MKTILIVIIITTFSGTVLAGPFDCLTNNARFTMAVNNDGSYDPNDPLGDIYFSLKGNNKYLVLDSKGPHNFWDPDGIFMVLKKRGKKFVGPMGNIIVHPFCADKEIYLELKGSPEGGFFMGLVNP